MHISLGNQTDMIIIHIIIFLSNQADKIYTGICLTENFNYRNKPSLPGQYLSLDKLGFTQITFIYKQSIMTKVLITIKYLHNTFKMSIEFMFKV